MPPLAKAETLSGFSMPQVPGPSIGLLAQADIGGELHLARGQAGGFGLVAPGRALRFLELAAAGEAGADEAESDEGEMNASHDRSNANRLVNGFSTR